MYHEDYCDQEYMDMQKIKGETIHFILHVHVAALYITDIQWTSTCN